MQTLLCVQRCEGLQGTIARTLPGKGLPGCHVPPAVDISHLFQPPVEILEDTTCDRVVHGLGSTEQTKITASGFFLFTWFTSSVKAKSTHVT